MPRLFPGGRRAALSISFDDARVSQIDNGLPILNARGLHATFYVSLGLVERRLEGWKAAIQQGHEIGNHTLSHPCSGNFPWSRANALEDYTLSRMAAELDGANSGIQSLLGVNPASFAYPCGMTFVGAGRHRQSYVPLVAERFEVGRAYLHEVANDPLRCDLAAAFSYALDQRSWEEMRSCVDAAIDTGGWVIFCSHEVGEPKHLLNTSSETLAALCDYAVQRSDVLWTDTVARVGRHIARLQLASVTADG